MARRRHAELGFTDLLFNALLGFVVMFVLAFLLINPVAETGAVDNKAEFLITLTWPDGRKEDIDLYVADPEGRMVWFRAREAGLMHLDRDDLGLGNDVIEVGGKKVVNPVNQEIVSIRGIASGEYIVNLHLYRDNGGQPVPTKIKVEKLNPRVEIIFYGDLTLQRRGEEQTAVRFSIRADGTVHDVNRLAKSIVPHHRRVSRLPVAGGLRDDG